MMIGKVYKYKEYKIFKFGIDYLIPINNNTELKNEI